MQTISRTSKTKNPIFEYYNAIKTKKIIACEKIKKFYKYITEELKKPESPYYYSEKHAEHAINFIEKYCKHSKGKFAGKKIVLELWQRAFLACLFGVLRKSDDLRRFREAVLFVARKNGKSVFASGIGLYMFTADGEGGAECYSVATKRDQAKITWAEARSMVKKSPALCARVKTLIGELVYGDNKFQPLSSESNNLDGLNTHFCVMDEIHAWKDLNLYDVMADSVSAREQPLILIISTMGTVRENVFDKKYDECERVLNGYCDPEGYKDDKLMPVIYELDKRSEWSSPNAWIKANPNLNVSKSSEYLQSKVNKAKGDSFFLKNTLTKDFNIRETSSEAWLSFEDIDNSETFDITVLKPNYAIVGADFSRTTDLTAACILFGLPGTEKLFVYSMYWLPEDLLEKRTKEDKIPYDIWAQKGLLRLCPGNKIDEDCIIDWFKELYNPPYNIYLQYGGYDAWSALSWAKKMRDNFGDVFEPVHQGKKTLSLPMQLLGAELQAKRINYNNNPITKWCLTNTRCDVDKNGNIQPAKTSNSRQRIDGTAAMLNAYTIFTKYKEEYLNGL